MATAPACLVGLDGSKGAIAPGYDADLVAFDAEATFTVDERFLEHRHPITPYHGRTLAGRVDATWLRGTLVFREGDFPGPPSGRSLLRKEAR
jgi:allantoinase